MSTVSSVGSVAAVTVSGVDGDGGDGGLGGLTVGGVGRSGLAVGVGVLGGVTIVVLGPLVVVSPDLARVLLVVVGLGVDAVVGLAPSGVVVGAVGLLGPLVVVVSGVLGSVRLGRILVVSSSVRLLGGGAVATVGFAVGVLGTV